ncbi:MAG: hypothetical protein R3273_06535 [Pseudidiomarina maritima]|nr:hypothetical protein [Pseudidiomarina maritima]
MLEISKRAFGYMGVFVSLMIVTGCATQTTQQSPSFSANQVFYVMPFDNQSNMPLAQAQVEQLVASSLAERGLTVRVYPKTKVNDVQASLEPQQRHKEAQQWLLQQPPGYVVQGAVHEWQYKYGLDGEPAVGVTLMILNHQAEELWRGSVSRSGWGRESITQVGLEALSDVFDDVDFNE